MWVVNIGKIYIFVQNSAQIQMALYENFCPILATLVTNDLSEQSQDQINAPTHFKFICENQGKLNSNH